MEAWQFEEEWEGGEGGRGRARPRRPMGWIAAAVAGGTAAGVAVEFPAWWGLAAGLGMVAGLFLCVGKRWSGWVILGLFFVLSAVHARQETGEGAGRELERLLMRKGEYARFEAVALEDAVFRKAGGHRASAGIFRARLVRVDRKGVWEECGGEVRVNVHGAEEGGRLPRYGERWRMSGVLTAGREYRSGLFRMRRNEAVVDPDRAECAGEGEGNPFMEWCWGRRRACRAALARGLEEGSAEAGVLQAMLLGYREDLPEALRADFASTGTVHIFAISGAHVGMVGMLLGLLMRALMVPKTKQFWVLAPALAVYVATTGAATSAVRAAVMAGCLSLAPALRRRGDGMSGLALAATLILLASPAQVADVGFLLSFSAVWGILTLNPLLERAVLGRWRRDPWALAERKGEGERGDSLGIWFGKLAVLGVSVWVATLPLTLLMFQLVSPVAPLMNLLVIPSALGILLAGVLSLAVSWAGAAGAWLGATFNLGGGMVAGVLAGAIRWAAGIPWGHAFAEPPPGWGVAAWMGAIWGGCALARRGRRWGLWAMWGALAALAAGWWGWTEARTRVRVLGAAPGQAILVQSRGARALLDAGPNYRATPVNRQLREAGVNGLDVVVLSHPDAAHTGAAPEILAEHPAKELWIPARRWKVPSFEATVEACRAAGMEVRELKAGDEGDFGGAEGVHWEVLWPPEDAVMACADDAAMMIRLSRGTHAALVAGDFGGAQEAEYLRRVRRGGDGWWRVPAAGTLVVGRHGGDGATSEEWLKAVNPRLAVASCANGKDARLPSPETVERVEGMGIEFWRAEPGGVVDLPGW